MHLKQFRLKETVGSGYLKGMKIKEPSVLLAYLKNRRFFPGFFDFVIFFPGLVSGVRVSRSGNY